MAFNTNLNDAVSEISKRLLLPIIVILILIMVLISQVNYDIRDGVGDFVKALLPPTEATVETRNIVVSGLKKMSNLTTTKISEKATVVTKQENKLAGFTIGNTNLVYEGFGTVEAGIDMNKLEVKDVDMRHQRIRLVLPQPQITAAYLNVNGSSIVAHYKKWFGSNVESELQQKAESKALKDIIATACANHVLEEANKNAAQLVEQILKTANYKTIIIETQLPEPGACRAA